jgi:hypothetical protein
VNEVTLLTSYHRGPIFDPMPVAVKYVVNKVALGQVFIQVLRFTAVNIIPQMLHTHLSATNATQ